MCCGGFNDSYSAITPPSGQPGTHHLMLFRKSSYPDALSQRTQRIHGMLEMNAEITARGRRARSCRNQHKNARGGRVQPMGSARCDHARLVAKPGQVGAAAEFLLAQKFVRRQQD